MIHFDLQHPVFDAMSPAAHRHRPRGQVAMAVETTRRLLTEITDARPAKA
jgi:hypothetical protein